MPSSISISCQFELQFTGENVNTWGLKLSNTLARVDDAIGGYTAIAITGDYTLSSTTDNTASNEARQAHLKFTGTLSANATITLRSVSKSYRIWNATNKTLTFSLGSGNTAQVETGDKLDIWSDGTNVSHATAFGSYSLKEYIAAQVLASSTALPGQVGNAGKYLYTDGASATWRQTVVGDISDYLAETRKLALLYSLIF